VSNPIFIGDVHGCIEELLELLNLLPENRKIVFLGDIVDKGPNSEACAEVVRELCYYGHECLLGNHDEWWIRYTNGGPSRGMVLKDTSVNLSNETIEFFKSLPIYIADEAGKWLAVHGGVLPGISNLEELNDKKSKALNLRRVTDEGKFARLGEGGIPWPELYDGRFGIVMYGHEAFDSVRSNNSTHGIDTSCVYGGKLTAVSLNDEGLIAEEWSVNAKRKYRERN
jgi:protein phosphatase